MFALDPLRVSFAGTMHLRRKMTLIGAQVISVIACFAALSGHELQRCFTNWIKSLVKVTPQKYKQQRGILPSTAVRIHI